MDTQLISDSLRMTFGPAHQKRRILLIEDDESTKVCLRRMILEMNPHIRVDSADSVPGALTLLEKTDEFNGEEPRYDLILSDENLDGPVKGSDLAEICRHLRIASGFVITSSHRPKNTAVPFLQKPYRRDAVVQFLTPLLDGRPYSAPSPPDEVADSDSMLFAFAFMIWAAALFL